jgi:hypothetical protein
MKSRIHLHGKLTNRFGERPCSRSMNPLCTMMFGRWCQVESVVTSRWFYKTKYVAYCIIEKHKALFVAHGFS